MLLNQGDDGRAGGDEHDLPVSLILEDTQKNTSPSRLTVELVFYLSKKTMWNARTVEEERGNDPCL